jgi:hypothetical protein
MFKPNTPRKPQALADERKAVGSQRSVTNRTQQLNSCSNMHSSCSNKQYASQRQQQTTQAQQRQDLMLDQLAEDAVSGWSTAAQLDEAHYQ